MKHCIYCGAEMPDEAKFCGVCGKPFSGEQLQQSTVTQQTVTPQQVQQQSNTVIIQSQSNSVGTVGFVFALLSFILFILTLCSDAINAMLSLNPCLICGLVGYICSIIGLYRKPNGLAITGGIIVSIESIICFIYNIYKSETGVGVSSLLLLISAIVFFILVAKQKKQEKNGSTKQTETNKI